MIFTKHKLYEPLLLKIYKNELSILFSHYRNITLVKKLCQYKTPSRKMIVFMYPKYPPIAAHHKCYELVYSHLKKSLKSEDCDIHLEDMVCAAAENGDMKLYKKLRKHTGDFFELITSVIKGRFLHEIDVELKEWQRYMSEITGIAILYSNYDLIAYFMNIIKNIDCYFSVAAESNRKNILTYFCSKYDIPERDEYISYGAALSGNMDLLKEHCMNLPIKDLNDVLEYAISGGNRKIAEFLLDKGAKLNNLIEANVEVHTEEMAQFLVDNNAVITKYLLDSCIDYTRVHEILSKCKIEKIPYI